jgi:AcrR family transcriptional regulator
MAIDEETLVADDGIVAASTVAIALISRHGFAGTSLQMIADELGFSKAAIYYHFRTRDQLLVAVMEPILHQIRQVVQTAESQRTPRTQMDAMVHGFAEVVAKNRSLAAVMVFVPGVHRVLQLQPDWGDLIARQLALLMQLEPGQTGSSRPRRSSPGSPARPPVPHSTSTSTHLSRKSPRLATERWDCANRDARVTVTQSHGNDPNRPLDDGRISWPRREHRLLVASGPDITSQSLTCR